MKAGDFTTPTGQSGNVLNIWSWLRMVLGVVVLLVSFALGEKVFNVVRGKVPGADLTIKSPITPTPHVASDPYNWSTP